MCPDLLQEIKDDLSDTLKEFTTDIKGLHDITARVVSLDFMIAKSRAEMEMLKDVSMVFGKSFPNEEIIEKVTEIIAQTSKFEHVLQLMVEIKEVMVAQEDLKHSSLN